MGINNLWLYLVVLLILLCLSEILRSSPSVFMTGPVGIYPQSRATNPRVRDKTPIRLGCLSSLVVMVPTTLLNHWNESSFGVGSCFLDTRIEESQKTKMILGIFSSICKLKTVNKSYFLKQLVAVSF